MKRIVKHILIACILCLCLALTVSLASCKNDGEGEETSDTAPIGTVSDEVTLFDGESYTARVVYASEGVIPTTEMRSGLLRAFGEKLEAKPEMIRDTDADASGIELLLGSTNRAESAVQADAAEGTAWYYVGVVGDKLVINGSNEYMLGLALDCFISDMLGAYESGALTVTPDMTVTVMWEDYTTDGWMLTKLPYYKGARVRYSMMTYDAGKMITTLNDSGSESSVATAVSKTTVGEFKSYIERLESFGYTKVNENALENNSYVTLTNGTDRVYTYYVGDKNTANIIIDNISASPEDISYSVTAEANKGAAIYMYGLNMDPYVLDASGAAGYPNNGMLLIIRCADNSVIIIDGGDAVQMSGVTGETVKPMEKLNAFLHDITDTPDGERVVISCWYLTHLHKDHFGGFREFITSYYEQYDLKSICANIPTQYEDINSQVSSITSFSSFLTSKYPECKEIKIHTGQSIRIADVTLQALFTHEDAVGASSGKLVLDDSNNTTTVMKISTDSMSMLVLGDALDVAEDFLLDAYTEETLKCDIVQVAHHALNGMTEIYDTVKADIYLVPQSYGMYLRREEVWEIPVKTKLDELFTSSTAYFSGKYEYTVGLQVIDGVITVVHTPAELPEYDPNDFLPQANITTKEDEETQWSDLKRVNR